MKTSHEIKLNITTELEAQAKITDVAMYKKFGNRQADIYARVDSTPIAIQLLYKHLSVSELEKRTAHFVNHGLTVLWILPYELSGKIYNRKTYNWLLNNYSGKIYCNTDTSKIVAIAMQKIKVYIPERKWHKDKEDREGGGYFKFLRRMKYARPITSPMSVTEFVYNRRCL